MPCEKCGNKSLPPRETLPSGISVQPCCLCGFQHYIYPPGMQKINKAPDRANTLCRDCGEDTGGQYAYYCPECRAIRQYSASQARTKGSRKAPGSWTNRKCGGGKG